MKEYKKNLTVFAGFYFKNALKARRRACTGKLVGACTRAAFCSREIATAVSHRRQAGWRGYASGILLPRDCHGGEPPQASGLARVRGVPFLSRGISPLRYRSGRNDIGVCNLLSLPPGGKGGLPKRCEGKTDEGKTTLRLLLGFIPLIFARSGSLTLTLVPPPGS